MRYVIFFLILISSSCRLEIEVRTRQKPIQNDTSNQLDSGPPSSIE